MTSRFCFKKFAKKEKGACCKAVVRPPLCSKFCLASKKEEEKEEEEKESEFRSRKRWEISREKERRGLRGFLMDGRDKSCASVHEGGLQRLLCNSAMFSVSRSCLTHDFFSFFTTLCSKNFFHTLFFATMVKFYFLREKATFFFDDSSVLWTGKEVIFPLRC